MSDASPDNVPSSLARGLSLLELFSPDERELTVNEMARRAAIPKSTTHRLVGDLLNWGALERGKGGVRLGVRMFELGNLVPDHARLRELAIPFAHSLAELTHLTVNLAVRDGDEIIYLEKINSFDLNVPHSRIGGRLPMHCTALGKAILAFSTPQFADDIMKAPLVARTPKTITDPPVLRHELAEVRRSFVAYDLEESQLGLFCVAAPIFTRQHRVIGGISVTDAVSRSQARGFGDLVRSIAQSLSRALGDRQKSSNR